MCKLFMLVLYAGGRPVHAFYAPLILHYAIFDFFLAYYNNMDTYTMSYMHLSSIGWMCGRMCDIVHLFIKYVCTYIGLCVYVCVCVCVCVCVSPTYVIIMLWRGLDVFQRVELSACELLRNRSAVGHGMWSEIEFLFPYMSHIWAGNKIILFSIHTVHLQLFQRPESLFKFYFADRL
jgi:hypothetical protein